MRDVVAEDFLLGATQRRPDRRDLRDHVDAIAVFLDHAGESADLAFDPVADFTGVIRIASMPTILIVPPDLPVSSLKEFVDYVRARPKQLNFASSGIASTAFIGAELFRQTAKLEMTHVPYKGSPEAQESSVAGIPRAIHHLSVRNRGECRS